MAVSVAFLLPVIHERRDASGLLPMVIGGHDGSADVVGRNELSARLPRRYLGNEQREIQMVSNARKVAVNLTPRQKDVLKQLARGLSKKEAAFEMGLSVKTVEYYWAQIIIAFDTPSQFLIALRARDAGIV
jgi:DNA-binding NarL/FixJ family response regulator